MVQRRFAALALLLVTSALGSAAADVGDVVINEIAWAGRDDAPKAEWIELLNTTSAPVSVEDWVLSTSDGAPTVHLRGTISPRLPGDPKSGLLLLERSTDDAVPGVAADLVYEGALTDAGEILYLRDREGHLVDTANVPTPEPSEAPNVPPADPLGWMAGTASGTHGTMERVDPLKPDSAGNWLTNDRLSAGEGAPTPGTPRLENDAFNLPPVPIMTFTPTSPGPGEEVRFSALSSADQNDEIVLYEWDFGDGSTAKGQTPSHTFVHVGSFEVRLAVTDSKNLRIETTRYVDVRAIVPPLADFSLLARSPVDVPRTEMPLTFIDESSHRSAKIIEHAWDFGDGGTASGTKVSHCYEAAGTYVVQLAVTDTRGNTTAFSMEIIVRSLPPTATFQLASDTIHAGKPTSLDASSSNDEDGEIAIYHWDLDGDGTVDVSGPEPVQEHTFGSAGAQQPTLIVEDDQGERSQPFSRSVLVNAVPIPQFSISDTTPEELAEVTFTDLSHDPDGEIVSWEWEFGEGELSIQTSPVHAFQDDGTFSVRLNITDDRGGTAVAEMTVHVSNLSPIAALDVRPGSEGDTGTPFRFDASNSTDQSPNGRIVTYEWDLDGDGDYERQTTTPNVSHTYEEDGHYGNVTVRVTDDDGASEVSVPARIHVRNRPPIVHAITWAPEEAQDGYDVQFVANAIDPDGSVARWRWNFGDGDISEEQTPTHVFQHDGNFIVEVVAIDDQGLPSPPSQATVSVRNAAPEPRIAVSQLEGGHYEFDGSGSYDPSPEGRIVHVAWDFGDGSTCPGLPSGCGGQDRISPTHRFLEPGAYTVILILIDDEGAIARQTVQLVVD